MFSWAWKLESLSISLLRSWNVWEKFTILNNTKSQSLLFLFALISIFLFQPATSVELLFGIFYVSTIVVETLGFVFNATLHFGGETSATWTNLIMVLTYLTLLTHGQELCQSHVRDERMEMNLSGCVLTGFNHSAWNYIV